jgi:transcriptional regulator with PAS, ATPase and Fis domain
MYPKQKSYIPRFALLIHIFSSNFDEKVNVLEVTKDSILKAEKLSNYFIMNAKKIKIEAAELKDIKSAMKGAETTYDKLLSIYKSDANFNRTKVAEQLGISRQQVINLIKKIEEK